MIAMIVGGENSRRDEEEEGNIFFWKRDENRLDCICRWRNARVFSLSKTICIAEKRLLRAGGGGGIQNQKKNKQKKALLISLSFFFWGFFPLLVKEKGTWQAPVGYIFVLLENFASRMPTTPNKITNLDLLFLLLF